MSPVDFSHSTIGCYLLLVLAIQVGGVRRGLLPNVQRPQRRRAVLDSHALQGVLPGVVRDLDVASRSAWHRLQVRGYRYLDWRIVLASARTCYLVADSSSCHLSPLGASAHNGECSFWPQPVSTNKANPSAPFHYLRTWLAVRPPPSALPSDMTSIAKYPLSPRNKGGQIPCRLPPDDKGPKPYSPLPQGYGIGVRVIDTDSLPPRPTIERPRRPPAQSHPAYVATPTSTAPSPTLLAQ